MAVATGAADVLVAATVVGLAEVVGTTVDELDFTEEDELGFTEEDEAEVVTA